jgi:bifunctional DNA-binding transcriptional regulator/antitoxin component of YhaV-PrlF toxin-antitoxin module
VAIEGVAKVDAEGRLRLPEALRHRLGIDSGDIFLVAADESSGTLHFTRAENLFDILAAHAIAEYRAGRTKSLREFAAEQAFSLDDE